MYTFILWNSMCSTPFRIKNLTYIGCNDFILSWTILSLWSRRSTALLFQKFSTHKTSKGLIHLCKPFSRMILQVISVKASFDSCKDILPWLEKILNFSCLKCLEMLYSKLSKIRLPPRQQPENSNSSPKPFLPRHFEKRLPLIQNPLENPDFSPNDTMIFK